MPFDLSIPLRHSDTNTFMLITGIKTSIRQKLKCLLLTVPGERLMVPAYGVGIRNYLFAHANSDAMVVLTQAIRNQIKQFMPYVVVNDITIQTHEVDLNRITLRLLYSIP